MNDLISKNSERSSKGPFKSDTFCLVFNPLQDAVIMYKVDTVSIPISIDERQSVELSCNSNISEKETKQIMNYLKEFFSIKEEEALT